MHAVRLLGFLCAFALIVADTACATIIRGSRADITFRNAPENLQAFEEDGAPVAMQKQSDGTINGQIGFHTRKLTLTSGSTTTKVDLDARISAGYVVVDLLLYLFPAAIDFGTAKWTNFEDVDAKVALAKGSDAPARDPWAPKESVPGGKPRPLIQQASSQPLIQLAPTPAPRPIATPKPLPAPQPIPAANPGPAERRTPVFTNGKLAVLDFKSYSDALKPEDVRYFSDVVRGATLRASPSLQVMTRENLLVLLQATGKDAANCEGECEVDTGRRIGADAVVSGEILKVGSHFKLSLKLHETRDGRLLSTSVASGRSIDELDDSAQAAAIDLISPIR